MQTKHALIAVFLSTILVAADKVQPLNAKPGMWELSISQQMSGAPPVPPDVLAKMSPEQREKIEAMFKQQAGKLTAPRIRKSCITQEQLSKNPFTEERPGCQRTVISSTSTVYEFHQECTENGAKIVSDGKFEAPTDSTMKGTMKTKADNAGRVTNVNIDMSGKWLSADCATAPKASPAPPPLPPKQP